MPELNPNPSSHGTPGVFGTGINPLMVYLQQQAGRQAGQAEAHKEARKKRDEFIGDLQKFNPDKVWEPFYDEVNRYVQTNVRDHAFNQLNQGVPHSRMIADLEKRKGEANTLVNKINWLKSQHTDLASRIKDDQYLDKSYYNSKLNDAFFNGMVAKPVNEIKTDKLPEMFDDSKGYKLNEITKDFMTSLPAKINEHYKTYWDQLGKNYDIQDTSTKLGLQYNSDGSVILDPRTGQPKIQMTDDVYTQALGNKYLMNVVKDNLPPEATHAQKREFLTGILEGLDPKQIKNRPQVGHKLDKDDRIYYHFGSGGGGYRHLKADLEDRDALLNRAVTGKGDDVLSYFGEMTKDIKARYEVKNGKRDIAVDYPSYIKGFTPLQPEELAALPPLKQAEYLALASKSKSIQTSRYPVNTEDERRAAKIALSQRMDEIDKKRSIGEEYMKYINEKRKSGKKGSLDNL